MQREKSSEGLRPGRYSTMNKNSNSRTGFVHLYNPKKEGLGSYDVNYINAYKKDKRSKNQLTKQNEERYVA